MSLDTQFGARLLASGAFLFACLAGCGSSAPTRPTADGGTGGTAGTAGMTGSGGNGENGGNGGGASTGGSSGLGTGGAAGGGIAGTSGTGGRSGTGGGAAGGSATGGAGGTVGTGGLTSAGGNGAGGNTGTVNCVRALFGRYLLRNDGVLLFGAATTAAQTPVLNDSTGLPLAGVTNAQDGANHGCAIVAGGAVSCWQTAANAGNTAGQLGNGTVSPISTVNRATPVLTAPSTPLTGAVSLAIGDTVSTNSACAVTQDGKLYCWGDLTWIVNAGIALPSPYAQPVTTNGIDQLSGVLEVSLAGGYSCAVRTGASSNEVWCWGYNGANGLGQGDRVNRQYATKVLGLTNPTKVVTSSYVNLGSVSIPTGTTCVLDGSNVRCWGSSRAAGAGGPGDASGANIASPTLVTLQDGVTVLPDLIDLQSGTGTFCALRTGNTLWCWGAVAANYGATNVVGVGSAGPPTLQILPRFVTSDGVYHIGMTPVTPRCGAL